LHLVTSVDDLSAVPRPQLLLLLLLLLSLQVLSSRAASLTVQRISVQRPVVRPRQLPVQL